MAARSLGSRRGWDSTATSPGWDVVATFDEFGQDPEARSAEAHNPPEHRRTAETARDRAPTPLPPRRWVTPRGHDLSASPSTLIASDSMQERMHRAEHNLTGPEKQREEFVIQTYPTRSTRCPRHRRSE